MTKVAMAIRRGEPSPVCAPPRQGLSLVEILAVITIVGILAAVIVPRFAGRAHSARSNACAVSRGYIEVQAELWYRNNQTWPNSSLADIGSDPRYFPDGVPRCPVDGSEYQLDAQGRVIGHDH